jgi:O-acetyl-ADP-ribose deacetylase (regulator of RNase III)
MTNISLLKGDITTSDADAIVNAANNSLLGGGGVDYAIHKAAGDELLEECRTLHGCETGQAKITKGYRLPAKYVIHTVGPRWEDGSHNEEQLLRDAYDNSLLVAIENKVQTIAFPNISTGIYGFPKQKAAIIALLTVNEFCKKNPDALGEITFYCFDEENYNIYRSFLKG